MDFSVVARNVPYLAGAFWLTLETAALVIAGGTVAGLLLGFSRWFCARLSLSFFSFFSLVVLL